MHASVSAGPGAKTPSRDVLIRLEDCLNCSVVDLKGCTDLILSDGVLLAHVLRLAERSGKTANAKLSECIVLCGKSRLQKLCRVLRQHSRTKINEVKATDDSPSMRRLIVC